MRQPSWSTCGGGRPCPPTRSTALRANAHVHIHGLCTDSPLGAARWPGCWASKHHPSSSSPLLRLLEAHYMMLSWTPTLWKTAFAWVLLGGMAIGHAQTNDQGRLDFSGTITKATPQLSAGQTLSVQAEFATTEALKGPSRSPAPYTASIPLTILYQ